MTNYRHDNGSSNETTCVYSLDWNIVVAALATLVSAWIAAGSMGLLAHPLRRALVLVGVMTALVSGRPTLDRSWVKVCQVLIMVTLAVALISVTSFGVNVLGCALIAACLASTANGRAKNALKTTSIAIGVFSIYRMALTSLPWFWLLTDWLAALITRPITWMTGQALAVGPTYAGLDFPVLLLTLCLCGVRLTEAPRQHRYWYGIGALVLVQTLYLCGLSFVPAWLQSVSELSVESPTWGSHLLPLLIPSYFPVVLALLSLVIAGILLRWTPWQISGAGNSIHLKRRRWMAWILAMVLPVIMLCFTQAMPMVGKKVVFYEKGFLNWLKPEHESYGRLSSGMYGMLPSFVRSLGAQAVISPDLDANDLEDADVLVLLFPDDPWQDGQLERIERFVSDGGSLLVMGEHTSDDLQGRSRFNEVLTPTAMHVNFDSATFDIGGWLHSYQMMAHPTTLGMSDQRNEAGVVIGASVHTRWPARPLVMGRWGWSDWGDHGSTRAKMGNGKYDPGERLGDLILAAEQPVGKGRVITFGDTSSLTNGIAVGAHAFINRLFSYLAGRQMDPHAPWRQFLALMAGVALICLLVYDKDLCMVTFTLLILAGSVQVCSGLTVKSHDRVPSGSSVHNIRLAYVDASHLEAYSSESWRTDGIGGLILTLMRNGYLTLSMDRWSAKRLEQADLLISIAPSRAFTSKERQVVQQFVLKGGTFIVTAGFERAGGCQDLLKDFGFFIGRHDTDTVQVRALGHFKSPYLQTDVGRAFVRFHAAFPVVSTAADAQVLAYGADNLPVMMMRSIGQGRVVVVGDTGFAMNKNLEHEDGSPFEGLRENADFWRWLLSRIKGESMWIPPRIRPATEEVAP